MTDSNQTDRRARLQSRFEAAGQGHVFENFPWDSPPATWTPLLDHLEGIPVDKLCDFVNSARASQELDGILPFDGSSAISDDPCRGKWEISGKNAISSGQVAVVVVAGGQGTRLGWSGAKGTYPRLGLPSGRTLFQLIAERIGRLRVITRGIEDGKDSGGGGSGPLPSVPLYVMTSPMNNAETREYFKAHDSFGLPPSDVQFFSQGTLPCLYDSASSGTCAPPILMDSATKVALAPDGNGGVYRSLSESGMLDDMGRRGIKHLHFISVDNILVRPADPVFIGYCIECNADVGNKAVWKCNADEKVGVLAETNIVKEGGEEVRRPCIVEYSDLSEEMRHRRDEDGKLVFGAGNICNHYFTYNFVREVVVPKMDCMYHIAKKQISVYHAAASDGDEIRRTSVPGIKLESFIFDCFALSKSMAVLDVPREDEFSPVKNSPGVGVRDSPDTARAALSTQARAWAVAAGAVLTGHVNSDLCEIGPDVSYAGEGLVECGAVTPGAELKCPFRF